MTDLLHALRAALTANAEATRRHDASVQALERAQHARTAAQAECARLAEQDDQAIERAARRLEAQAREGDAGSLPRVTPSDRHLMAQIIAERTLKAADRAIATLEAEMEQSAAELSRAKALLHGARDALVGARVGELLVELEKLRIRETEIVRLVAVIGTGDYGAASLPREARAMVAYPPARPTADSIIGGAVDLNTPIGGTSKLNEEARAHWAQYLADLERESETSAPAEAAA